MQAQRRTTRPGALWFEPLEEHQFAGPRVALAYPDGAARHAEVIAAAVLAEVPRRRFVDLDHLERDLAGVLERRSDRFVELSSAGLGRRWLAVAPRVVGVDWAEEFHGGSWPHPG